MRKLQFIHETTLLQVNLINEGAAVFVFFCTLSLNQNMSEKIRKGNLFISSRN